MTRLIAAIIAGVVVVAAVVWKYFRNEAVAPMPQPVPTPTPQPIPTPVPPSPPSPPTPTPTPAPTPVPTPTPEAAAVVTVSWDKSLDTLKVGDVATATVKLNGVLAPVATRCEWAVDQVGVVQIAQSTTLPGISKLTAMKVGWTDMYVFVGTTAHSQEMKATVAAAPAPVPVPVPVPPVGGRLAPAAAWKRNRDWITMMNTNFYYNWLPQMYAAYAKMYDIMYSGSAAVVTALKALNPNLHYLPYTLEYTSLVDAPNSNPLDKPSLGTKYMSYFDQWCKDNAVDAVSAEAAWLHDATGKRVGTLIWDSPRNIGDPRNDVWRRFTVWRYQQMATTTPAADGFFVDEFGRGGMEPNFKLAGDVGNDPAALAVIEAAQVSLVQLISKALAAMGGKQLIVNTAAYQFPFDAACIEAALGTHMEQTNNPLSGNLVGNFAVPGNPPPTWSFIDVLLQHGVFVNMVPPYQFGEYESQVGGAGTTHMDTPRGKLLELASYYMVVTDPGLLGLSIENGDWARYTPIQNWVPQIDAPIGRALALRMKAVAQDGTTHCWMREFANGLVYFNPIYSSPTWDRSKMDFGLTTVITLPSDRPYFRVLPDGSTGTVPSTQIAVRMPEAVVFVCKPIAPKT